MHAFEVDATNPAAPRVTVDGVEQSGVARVTVDVAPGQTVPAVYLEFQAGARFVGAGDVQIGLPPPAVVRAWLDTVSPGELDRVVLEMDRQDGGLSRSPGVTYLAALRTMLPRDGG